MYPLGLNDFRGLNGVCVCVCACVCVCVCGFWPGGEGVEGRIKTFIQIHVHINKMLM